MEMNQIFILNADAEQNEVLLKLADEDGYTCKVFSSVEEISKELKQNYANLYLLDYTTLLKASRQEVIIFFQSLRQREIAVYNVPADATRRLAFYELGARRVYDEGHSLHEIYLSLRWLLRVVTKEDGQANLSSHGTLEDLPLHLLIPVLSSEQRTGILILQAANASGKIYLNNGHVVDAQTGPHTGAEAFYHMMLWIEGKFTFSANEERAPENRILLSNYGLLNQGSRLRGIFNRQQQDLAPMDRVMRVTRLGDLQLSHIQVNEGFLEFIKRPRTLEEILENPYYTAHQTMELLTRLKKDGFLLMNAKAEPEILETISEDSQQTVQIQLSPRELAALRENLKLEDQQTIKIAILSSGQSERCDYIDSLAGSHEKSSGPEGMEVARIQINNALKIILIGMELNQSAVESLDEMIGVLAGFIFLLDASAPEQFEYINYVMNQILTANPLPSVVAVTHIPEKESVHGLRSKFITPEHLTWIKKPDDALHLLFSIYPFEIEEEETETEEEA